MTRPGCAWHRRRLPELGLAWAAAGSRGEQGRARVLGAGEEETPERPISKARAHPGADEEPARLPCWESDCSRGIREQEEPVNLGQ